MGPEALAQVLRPLRGMFAEADYPDLVHGLAEPDDAAVWRLDATRALVLTSDFFPPVVDDAFEYGQIAASNALSDLYAMGARPILGINLVGFPADLDSSILEQILRGGADKMREAGAVIAGGHTTTDHEPKYGLAVIGFVHPDRILTKHGTRPGDVLYLTKPLGTGVVTTALKKNAVEGDHLAAAVECMRRLNATAAAIVTGLDGAVRAATDITGFGLAGHLHEVAERSGAGLRLRWDDVPLLPGAERYARKGLVPGGAQRNRSYYKTWVRASRTLETWQSDLLHDPQTAGGLVLCVDPTRATEIEHAFARASEPLHAIGETFAANAGTIEII
jgi:selenide,water dikinase